MRFAICAFLLLSTAAIAQPATPAYHVSKTVALGAPDRWDYIVYDSSMHRVYVSHGDRVTVVDGSSGAILGDIQGAGLQVGQSHAAVGHRPVDDAVEMDRRGVPVL